MAFRLLSLPLAVLALAIFASQPALSAQDKSHEGFVVSAGDGKLTMTMLDGKKQHSHNVAADATIMLDDKKAKLEDLEKGFHIEVWVGEKNMVSKIEAHSKHKQ